MMRAPFYGGGIFPNGEISINPEIASMFPAGFTVKNSPKLHLHSWELEVRTFLWTHEIYMQTKCLLIIPLMKERSFILV